MRLENEVQVETHIYNEKLLNFLQQDTLTCIFSNNTLPFPYLVFTSESHTKQKHRIQNLGKNKF